MISAHAVLWQVASPFKVRPWLGADDVMLGPGSVVQSSLLAHGRGTTTECETGSDVGDEDDEARGAHPITARSAGLHMLHVRAAC